MKHQRMVYISQADFAFLAAIALHTGQPISGVVHTLIERTTRDREANGRLALQISALVDLHARDAAAMVDQAFADSTPDPPSVNPPDPIVE